ncbi:uncharacterized protein B0T15DRAFT_72788 [Chaetomium strumarium]|uniref:Autophagy-related protein 29 n=1 Tax=Chaetomium strumarium TaxID=1170767 RepID=A0AAJ0H440_9PEZI|nr:hypothetical protein B0T15DRAFT_72788 [Chaetomium strumarium]
MESRQRKEELTTDKRKRYENPVEERPEPRYHVYIRLPFKRGDFVDPGPVNWSDKKSEALWSILSDVSLDDVDWNKLAGQFDVNVDFVLQMANYLTERHASQLRAQMLKAAAIRGSNAPSPVPGADPPGGYPAFAEPLRRTGSGAGRAGSALSMRRENATSLQKKPDEPGGAAKTALPVRPQTSRTPSSNSTPVPAPVPAQSQPGSRPGTGSRSNDAPRRQFPHLQIPSTQQQQDQDPEQQQTDDAEAPPPSSAASTSSFSTSSSSDAVESRIIRRPPRFQPTKERRSGGDRPFDGDVDEEDDQDEEEPVFLPFKQPQQHQQEQPQTQGGSSTQDVAPGASSGSGQDLGATLRGDMRDLVGRGQLQTAMRGDAVSRSQTSDSSVGSAAIVPRRPTTAGSTGAGAQKRRVTVPPPATGQPGTLLQGGTGPLSPRRTAELAGKGPGPRGKGASREGSEGTPSMGSSFSDLDDASVTQSALEEALASRMQDGTIGSRMSVIGGTIGQAFRSRVLPRSNRQ